MDVKLLVCVPGELEALGMYGVFLVLFPSSPVNPRSIAIVPIAYGVLRLRKRF